MAAWTSRRAASARPLVERPRLLERMQGRFERRLTLLVAGPGFGKTSLIAQAAESNAAAPRGADLRIECRPAHGALLGAELAVLAGAAAAGGGEAARAVADAIERRAPLQVAVVLDDVHRVPAGSPGGRLLAALLDALPDNGHLVLASRVPPDLPVARLESLGHVARIVEDDLRLSGAELAELAALRSVPVEALAPAAGWPALADLAAGRRGPSSFDDYLWEEVLAWLPLERRRDLAVLSGLLDVDLDAELAAAAVGHDVDLDDLLAELPLVARSGGRFRIHPLWRGALAARVDRPVAAAARAHAAEVLAGRGELEEAMPLAAEDGHWPVMRAVIRASCEAGRIPLAHGVLAGWLDALPERCRSEPEARLLAAVVSVERAPRTSAERFAEAVAAHRARGDRAGELSALLQWNVLAFRQADVAGLGAQAGRLAELAAEGLPEAGPLACFGRAMLEFTRGHWPGVLGALRPVREGALPRELAAAAAALSAGALAGQGDVADADQTSRLAVELAGPRYGRLAGRARVICATLACRWDEAATFLDDLLAGADRAGWLDSDAVDHALAALLACRTGDTASARGHLPGARRAEWQVHDRAAEVLLALARASCSVLDGDEASARAILRAELAARPPGAPGTHLPHLYHLALLYVLLPETRDAWDACDLPPAWSAARSAARALVALREHEDLEPAGRLGPFRPELLRVHLPAPWAVELAIAGSPAAGEPEPVIAQLGAAGTSWIEPLSRSAVPPVAERALRLLASVPLPPRQRMRLCLLGTIVLYRGDSVVDDAGWRHAKVRELLAHLAIHPEARRTDIIADLWPSLSEEAGANNLRVTLFALRAVLEPERPARGPSFVVRSDGCRLRLARGDHLEVDACAFEERLVRARHAESTGDELDAYLSALPLRRGPFLGDLFDAGWATAARADLDGQFVAAALRACELLMGRDPARALQLAGQVLEVDPASERAFRIKAAVYHRQGAGAAARQLLAVCRRELRRLHVEPEPETELLERLVGRDDG